MLDESERDRIAEAVALAEADTSAEVLCVLTEEASEYRETALAFGVLAALVAPPMAILAGARLSSLTAAVSGWEAAHGTPALGPLLSAYVLVQAAVFLAVWALVSWPPVRRRLTPTALKQRRVRRAAVQHFAGVQVNLPADRPAIMIFVSLKDRRMEVLADPVAHAAFGQDLWDKAIAEALATIRSHGVAAGMIRAVQLCGTALKERFPDDGAGNAVPDRVVEI